MRPIRLLLIFSLSALLLVACNGGSTLPTTPSQSTSTNTAIPTGTMTPRNTTTATYITTPTPIPVATPETTPETTKDLSNFTQFTFAQGHGLGFCPAFDSVFTADISRKENGDYFLNLSILEAGTAGVDDCISVFVSRQECVKETKLAGRVLTSAEVDKTLAVFTKMTITNETLPGCETIDPCRIDRFSWDSFAITDYICAAPRLLHKQSQVIVDLLDQIKTKQ